MRKLLASTAICTILMMGGAFAQCKNGLLSNCPQAVNPQSTDVLYGWQFGQNPHSRAFTYGSFQSNLTNVTPTGGDTAQSIANTVAWPGLYPYSFGAQCSGAGDDSAALQAWLNAGASGIPLALPQGVCAFKTPLMLANPTKLRIVGAGPYNSSLIYTGTNNNTDIISFGTVNTTTTNVLLRGFRVDSQTTMIGGAAIHLIDFMGSFVEDIIPAGQAGTKNLWNGIWFDGADHVVFNGYDVQAQNDAIDVDGRSGHPQADLFIDNGKAATSTVGIHIGGGFGGLYVGKNAIIDNVTNVLIDNALVAQPNRELFFDVTTAVDSATSNSIQINDTLASGATLDYCGWNASAKNYGLNVVAWHNSKISLCGGIIALAGSDGIHISDTTVKINISPATQIANNTGFGINASGALAINGFPASLLGTNAGGTTNNISFVDGPNAPVTKSILPSSTPTPASGGTGNAVGDALTLSDGCTIHAVLGVRAVTTGAVTQYSINNAGSCAAAPSNPVAVASTTGAGTGALFTLSWGPTPPYSLGGLLTGNNGNMFITAESPNGGFGGSETTLVGDRAGAGYTGSSSFNTAIGHNACGFGNGTVVRIANNDVCIGADAGRNEASTSVGTNVLIGSGAGRNGAGSGNIGIGYWALQGGTAAASTLTPSGSNNIAIGVNNLDGNGGATGYTTGHDDICIGADGCRQFTTDNKNIAIGSNTMLAAVGGAGNVVIGYNAGETMVAAADNVLVGQLAGNLTTGGQNVVVGSKAMSTGVGGSTEDTILGYEAGLAITIGTNDLVLGWSVGSTTLGSGSRDILIGTSSNCDVPTGGTNDYFAVCASSGSTPLLLGNLVAGTSVPFVINAPLNVTGDYQANGSPGVSCAANSVSLATFVVTNGIVTHC